MHMEEDECPNLPTERFPRGVVPRRRAVVVESDSSRVWCLRTFACFLLCAVRAACGETLFMHASGLAGEAVGQPGLPLARLGPR